MRALVERAQRLGRRIVDLDDDALPGRREDAQDALALAPVGLAQAALDEQHLHAEAGRGGSHPAHDRVDLLRAQVDHRPDVQKHAVPLQPAARLAVRLEAADSRERLDEHALELGQGDRTAVGVAHGGQITHLGQGEEPLVVRVGAAHTVEEVDILDRGQPVEREAREPGQAQSVRHRRVQAAQRLILDEPLRRGPERERGQRRHAAALLRPADGHHHAVHAGGQHHAGERGVQLLGERRAGRGLRRRVDVEVGHRQVAAGHRRRPVRKRVGGTLELGKRHVRRRELTARSLAAVAGEQERMPVQRRLVEPLERADTVEATRDDLAQQAAQLRAGVAHTCGEHRRQRPGARDQRGDPPLAVRRGGIGGQRRDVLVHLGVGMLARVRDHRLVEVAEADVAGEVREHRVAPLARAHEPVERLAEIVAHAPRQLIGELEPPVEDRHHRRPRGRGPLLGEEQPVTGLLQRGRAVQSVDPVVRERPAQERHERRRQVLSLRVERA